MRSTGNTALCSFRALGAAAIVLAVPCDRIGPVLGPQRAPVLHMRALPHQDVPAAVVAVQTSDAAPVVKPAFEFLVLTAARWGEVRGAEWAEIDSTDRVWTIPRDAHEGAARAPSPTVSPGYGDPRCGADARRPLRSTPAYHFSPRFPERRRDAAARKEVASAATGPEHRRRTAWLPVHLPGLGSRRNEPPARGCRGPRSRTWFRTKSKRPTPGRTCSNAGGGSWTSGPPTSKANAEGLSRQKAGKKWQT